MFFVFLYTGDPGLTEAHGTFFGLLYTVDPGLIEAHGEMRST